MSTLTVFNQTVTDLLPARKPAPAERPAPADRPEFDRQLKDAGERYTKPEQPADKTPTAKPVDETTNTEQPTTTTETDTKAEPQADPADVQSEQGDTTNTTEETPTENTSEPVTETEAPTDQLVATTTATQAAVATAQADALLAQQQAATQSQSTQTATTQTVVTDQNAQVQQAQQVNTQPTPTEQTSATPNQQAAEAAANLVTGPVQSQQVKEAQAANADTAAQNQPSATTERLAVVAEARQQSNAQQSGTNDTAQQDPGALKANAQAVQTQTTQNFTATAPSANTGINIAASVQIPVAGEAQVTSTNASSQVTPNTQAQDNNTQLNTARIERGLQNAVQQKGGAVTLRLTPPEMGTVRIQLQMHNGTVTAQFHAESESTRTLLSQQMSQLRSSLEQQGLTVDRLGVQTMNQTSGSNLHNESQSGREGQPNDGRSRGGFTRQGDSPPQQQNPDEPSLFDQELTTAA